MASFEFPPEAEAEFIEQIAYYAGIRRELGLRFQEAVAQAITETTICLPTCLTLWTRGVIVAARDYQKL
jgi:hypothetical protein